MKKVMILANNDVGLYKFRRELIEELMYPGKFIEGRNDMPYQVFVSLPDGKFVPRLKKLGCEFIETHVDRRGMNPINDLKLLNHYRKILTRIKPDIVLTYTIKPNIYGGIISHLLKIPYISNVTGLGTSIENKNFMSKVIFLLYKLGVQNANIVFFQNDINKQLFEKKRVIKNQGVLIPGSGVNLTEHCFEDYPENQETIKFLFIGRIMKDKGIEEYLECAETIKKMYPNTVFNIIGPYDDNTYKSKIESLIKQNIIQYYGSQADVHSFIKKHHAIILPSYHEGLSNVLLESAAAGRPVIATNVPGCIETFDDGITGLKFESKNSEALIMAVQEFLKIPYEKKKSMGIEARKKIENKYDRKIVIMAYLSVINKILKLGK